MRLKTKFQDEDFDFGEVVTANIYYGGNGRIKLIAKAAKGGDHTFYFETLKEMNEMFEDYEESKWYWYINCFGKFLDTLYNGNEWDEQRKLIGNYFSSREEAEKAVEKLKAFKRLKDKGFRFEGWTIDDGLRISVCTNFDSDGIYDEDRKEVKKDLDACFGGEE